MKKDIHPQYYTDATVICGSCGATWKTGSTQKEIRTEVAPTVIRSTLVNSSEYSTVKVR